MKTYREKAFDTVRPFGGRAIVQTGAIEVRETRSDKPWTPSRLLIVDGVPG